MANRNKSAGIVAVFAIQPWVETPCHNNTAERNDVGTYLQASDNNTLLSNSFDDGKAHGFGIAFGSASYRLIHNTASGNTFDGFRVTLSERNLLLNNNSTNNGELRTMSPACRSEVRNLRHYVLTEALGF